MNATPTNRAELIEFMERTLAVYFSWNRQPCMSGDMRDRLSPLRRRELSDAVLALLGEFDSAGFVVVPANPTPAMIAAMEEAYMPFGEMIAAYDAMVAAAWKEGA